MGLKDYLTHKQECNRNQQEQYNEWWLAIQDIEDPNQRDEQLKQYREEQAKCDCGLNDALNKAENLPISGVSYREGIDKLKHEIELWKKLYQQRGRVMQKLYWTQTRMRANG